tara:strand:+ start:1968 stop:2264 length:297 start_codon:yes stop_codon:yes gene_type:complete
MAYGLQIWDSSSNVRLDTTDRLTRYVAFYTGTITGTNSVTLTVSGYDITDDTWGIAEGHENTHLLIVSTTNTITLSIDQTTGSVPPSSAVYSLYVFRL